MQVCTSIAEVMGSNPLQATLLSGLKVQWFDGSLVHWFDGSLVWWIIGSMDLWFDGSLVRWIFGLMDPWFAGSMVWWINGSLVRWIVGLMDPWFDGSMDRWFDVGYFWETYLRQFESADHKFWRRSLDFAPFFRILSFLFASVCVRECLWSHLWSLFRITTADIGPIYTRDGSSVIRHTVINNPSKYKSEDEFWRIICLVINRSRVSRRMSQCWAEWKPGESLNMAALVALLMKSRRTALDMAVYQRRISSVKHMFEPENSLKGKYGLEKFYFY